MIEQLRLRNFRCFEDHTVQFGKLSILVGRNNSGKSTIVDALRLLANACRYAAYRYRELVNRDIPFPLVNLRHNYDDGRQTIITGYFDGGTEIEVSFPPDKEIERPHLTIAKRGKRVAGKGLRERDIRELIGVIPPVGAFEEAEELRDRGYLRKVMVSHLTPRHFRNIWHYFREGFDEFRALLETTCPGYTIEIPTLNTYDRPSLSMFVRERNVPREVFWCGHGFQVWLQLLTYLVKSGSKDTLVLDEPDIYLHSNLQKRLVSLCRERASQVVIATHAVEIIEEANPDEVVAVDKSTKQSLSLATVSDVQRCITQLGSSQNLKMVHFLKGRTCLFVEGGDFRLLKAAAGRLGLEWFCREDGFSVVELGGFSNWTRLLDVDWLFQTALGEAIGCYVLLDRDYRSDDEVEDICRRLNSRNVRVHIWERKELENYFLIPSALCRAVAHKLEPGSDAAEVAHAVQRQLQAVIAGMREDILAGLISAKFKRECRSGVDIGTLHKATSTAFDSQWRDATFRIRTCPGKDIFAKMNRWLQAEYQMSVSPSAVVRFVENAEFDPELPRFFAEFGNMVGF